MLQQRKISWYCSYTSTQNSSTTCHKLEWNNISRNVSRQSRKVGFILNLQRHFNIEMSIWVIYQNNRKKKKTMESFQHIQKRPYTKFSTHSWLKNKQKTKKFPKNLLVERNFLSLLKVTFKKFTFISLMIYFHHFFNYWKKVDFSVHT